MTTTALAIGALWRRPGRQPLVVEADPDGGVLAARFGLGAHPSLTDLAGRTRSGLRPTDAWDHAQHLPGGLGVVVAHPSAEQAQAALRTGASRIGEHLASIRHTDVLVGKQPYGASEVANTLGVDVVAVLADDPRGAAALDGSAGTKRWAKSALGRSAADAATAITARLQAEEVTVDLREIQGQVRGEATP